jgi:hypothetical protein
VNQLFGVQLLPFVCACHTKAHGNRYGARSCFHRSVVNRVPHVLSAIAGQRCAATVENGQKFFPAIAADRVITAHGVSEAAGNFAQDFIARRVPKGVVHFLEMIDVAENNRHASFFAITARASLRAAGCPGSCRGSISK